MKVAQAIRALNAAAAEVGGHVEDDSCGSHVTLQVCAPEGKIWNASDGAHLVVATYRGPQAWLDDAVADGLERIKDGVRDDPDEA